MKAFVSFSGGKESMLVLYRAMQNPDIEISHLLNMILSFVYDGPIFKNTVRFTMSKKVLNGKNWFLDLGMAV
ncbi:MAG: hypothetical protein AB1595_07205 [bacterium]